MRQAVILAGGKGTRLAERLNGLPKPLVPVCGIPLLQRQIEELRANGFTHLLILVNHRADAIRDFIAVHAGFGLEITVLDDGEPRGTAGAVLAAQALLDARCLVVYGDTLFGIDLDAFWRAHEISDADATLFLHPNDHPEDSDLVEIDESGCVTGFSSYPHAPGSLHRNLVNAALYMIERDAICALDHVPLPSDFAKDLFPLMLRNGRKLQGYESFEYIKDLGTPARLDRGERHLSSGLVDRARRNRKQRAVFLDRDGTLNISAGFVSKPEALELYPFAAEAVKLLHEAEYRTIVITNQPVIARGECTFTELGQIHAKLETELGRKGAFLDGLFFCPHHPDGGHPGEVAAYKIVCGCRKPGIGLIEEAVQRFNIDLSQSWFIGDTTRDMLCAERAGVRGVLVRTGEAGADGKYTASPEQICDNVLDAARYIVEHESDAAPLAEASFSSMALP